MENNFGDVDLMTLSVLFALWNNLYSMVELDVNDEQ